MHDATTKKTTLTVGLDVGDRYVQVCVLDEAGEVVEESRLPNKLAALERRFAQSDPLRIVLEAGTHSPWLSRLLNSLATRSLWPTPANCGSSIKTTVSRTGLMPSIWPESAVSILSFLPLCVTARPKRRKTSPFFAAAPAWCAPAPGS